MLFRVKMEAARLKEKAIIAIAWALPKTLVMWCAMRVGAHATTGEHSNQIVPELNFMDAVKRWETA
jgi:hypothetical protein